MRASFSGKVNVPMDSSDESNRGVSILASAMEQNIIGKSNKNRAPRYFDPPEKWLEWNARGETNYKCKARKAKKMGKTCYVCGDPDHRGNQCKQVKGCFICDKKGHLAMDCPNKTAGEDSKSQMCLKCGNSGHDMFTCTNDYDSEDLKAIQCYRCKNFGHLCCGDNKTEVPPKASCYKCGELDHLGQNCMNSPGQGIEAQKDAESVKRKRSERKKISSTSTVIKASPSAVVSLLSLFFFFISLSLLSLLFYVRNP